MIQSTALILFIYTTRRGMRHPEPNRGRRAEQGPCSSAPLGNSINNGHVRQVDTRRFCSLGMTPRCSFQLPSRGSSLTCENKAHIFCTCIYIYMSIYIYIDIKIPAAGQLGTMHTCRHTRVCAAHNSSTAHCAHTPTSGQQETA